MTPAAAVTASATSVILAWLAVIAGFDHRHSRIPNIAIVPGVAAVIIAGGIHPVVLAAASAGSLAYLLGFLAGACGAGDAKLAFVLGGVLGDPVSALVMVLIAQVITLAEFVLGRGGRVRRPHGPALAGAFLVTAAVGVVVGAWNN
ncbi:prepilin peptidase [Gordonia sp. NPDC003504]